jgi:hypothetical protein
VAPVRLQCWSSTRQLSPLAPIALPRKSVALPENAIVSPGLHVVPAAGEVKVGVGGVPAVTVRLVVSVSEPSETRRRTVTMPGVV